MGTPLVVLGLLVLCCALTMVGARWMRQAIGLYAMQGLLLASIAAELGLSSKVPHLLAVAVLVLAIKAFAVPAVLRAVIHRTRSPREIQAYLGVPSALLASGLLVLLAYHAGGVTAGLPLVLPPSVFSDALATLLVGFLLMINRRTVVTQVLGLLVMENGLFLAALALTAGMPLEIELAIFAEVLVGAVLLSILIVRIGETPTTDALASLRDCP